MVPNLGSPDVLGLKLPDAFTISCGGQDFWEMKSWAPKAGDHCDILMNHFRSIFTIMLFKKGLWIDSCMPVSYTHLTLPTKA